MVNIIALNSLFIMGLWIVTRYGVKQLGGNKAKKIPPRYVFDPETSMALGVFAWIIEKNVPKFIHKPLISCVTCMASVHGTWFYFAYQHMNGHSINDERVLLFWPIYILSVAAINTILWIYYERHN